MSTTVRSDARLQCSRRAGASSPRRKSGISARSTVRDASCSARSCPRSTKRRLHPGACSSSIETSAGPSKNTWKSCAAIVNICRAFAGSKRSISNSSLRRPLISSTGLMRASARGVSSIRPAVRTSKGSLNVRRNCASPSLIAGGERPRARAAPEIERSLSSSRKTGSRLRLTDLRDTVFGISECVMQVNRIIGSGVSWHSCGNGEARHDRRIAQ